MQPLSNRRRKQIARLTRRKYRERQGEYLIEGTRAVEAAVAAGAPLVAVVVTEAASAEPALRDVVEQVDAPVYSASQQEIARLSDVETPQGILAVARTAWRDEARAHEASRVLLLDGLQDPGNAGTIVRTAAWFGIDVIARGPGTVDLYHPKVVRAAMGGLLDVALVAVDDVAAFLSTLQDAGHTCYGADLKGTDVRTWRPAAPATLVIGSEAHGLSEGARRALDQRLVIPGTDLREATESLNASVATAIMLYAWGGV